MRKPVSGPDGAPIRNPEEQAGTHDVTVAGAASGGTATRTEFSEADTAVIVCHGMGQQVPFETLQLVIKAMQDNAGLGKVDVTVDLIPEDPAQPKGPTLPVAMATWQDPQAGRQNAHFFECYWAPLIEGKVGVWDVFAFLCKAGIRGIRFAWKGIFTRRIFGKEREFDLGGRTTWLELGLALILVLAVGCLAPTFLVTAVARGLYNMGGPIPRGNDLFLLLEAEILLLSRLILASAFPFLVAKAWDILFPKAGKRSLVQALAFTAFASLYFFLIRYELPAQAIFAAKLFFPASLIAYIACRMAESRAANRRIGPVAVLIWIHLLASILILVFMGGCCLWTWIHYWNVVDPNVALPWLARHEWLPAFIRDSAAWAFRLTVSAADAIRQNMASFQGEFDRPFLILHAAAGVGLLVGARFFLIEYAGDVAAYVSSHTVDRFYEVREKIQEACLRVAGHVYEAKAGAEWRYKRVIVVGHSLGSVLAYDTLNRMLLRDRLSGGSLGAAARTPLLLTFGSPLDKTAFLFRVQLTGADVREGLAEARQPMVHDYGQRPRRWINIWSPNDIISGPLEFYDLPKGKRDANAKPKGRRVRNLVDPLASMPVGAHTQYWANPLLARILARGLKGTL